ncbi:MAG TPA: sigma-70 family RNA polymerase sigma factor [Gemmataceae bacterium]|nr:sigma-70 family RNA polymerase sigma factor [Gemmataceae bacterium]
MPDPAVMKGVLRHLRRTERRRLYDLLGDGELLARFLAYRDEAAIEELVCRHGPMVRSVCRRVLGPTADADDAFQAAFLVLLRKARSIRRTDLLANWLCAVAYRTARQALRRRYRLGARERTGDDLPEPCRTDEPPRDWLPLFDAALQRLPSKYREPVVLCDLQGLSRPEAAKHLGLNEGTLSSRLGRARDLLRRKLSPHGFPLALGSALAPVVVPEALTASTAAAAANVSAASVSAIVLTEGVITAMFASKLKAGAACTAVLLVGTVAGLQLSGPVTLAGGLAKDGPIAREAAKEAPQPEAKAVLPANDVPLPAKVAKEESKPAAARNADLAHVIGAWELADVDGQTPDAAARKLDQDAQVGITRPDGSAVGPRTNPQRWERMRRLYLLPGGGPATLTYQPTVPLCLGYAELNVTKSPKWITLQTTELRPTVDTPGTVLPPAKSVRLCGIYKLDEDKMVLCLPEAEVSPLLRPADFRGDGEGGLYVLTYQRAAKQWAPETVKQSPQVAPAFIDSGTVLSGPVGPTPAVGVPALPVPTAPTDALPPTAATGPATVPPPTVGTNPVGPVPVAADFAFPVPPATAPTPSDLDQLQGVWTLVKRYGQPRPPDGKDEVLEFVKDRVLISTGRHGRIRIDASRDPKQMTLDITADGKTEFQRFIYKLEGDTLTLAGCHTSEKLVPIDFEPDQAAGIDVLVHERSKGPRPVKVSDGGVVGGMTLPSPRLPAGTPARPPESADSPAARDLRKEVDELREQIKRLERALKDRKPEPPTGH